MESKLETIICEQNFKFDKFVVQISIEKVDNQFYLHELHTSPRELIKESYTQFGRKSRLKFEYKKLCEVYSKI